MEIKPPAALLMVRSHVPIEFRADFDVWYATDHMPLAARLLGAKRGWRYWSLTDPAIHYAFYEFSDAAAAEEAQATPHNAGLIREFDARWANAVPRTREILAFAPLGAHPQGRDLDSLSTVN